MRCPNLSQLPPAGKIGWPWTEESPQLSDTMPNGKPWPRISIVTPSYNQGQFLEETIRSVLLQGYPNLEYIIKDGGSTDFSVEIIRKYEPWLDYWVSEPDQGQTYAIDIGMKLATGNLLNWLNSDDYLLPSALHALARAFVDAGYPACVICGNGIYVNERGTLLTICPIKYQTKKLLPGSPPFSGIQACWYLSKSSWQLVDGIDLSLNYTMDTDLHYRCYQKGITFIPIHQEIAAYRKHDETKTHKGWHESIAYKRRFYYSKLQLLSESDRKFYQKRVKRFISRLYLRSISSSDSKLLLIWKIMLALKESPMPVIYKLQDYFSSWKLSIL